MPPAIRHHYETWLGGEKVFGHPGDEERFFHFIRACCLYGKKYRGGHWLRQYLENDENFPKESIGKAVTWFDICCDYESATKSFCANSTFVDPWRPPF